METQYPISNSNSPRSNVRKGGRKIVFLFFLLFIGSHSWGLPQISEVPADLQYLLFTKILSYDRNFSNRVESNGDFNIAIVYQSKFRASIRQKEDFAAAVSGSAIKEVNGAKIQVTPINLSDNPDWEKQLAAGGFSAVYIAPLRAFSLSDILNFTRREKVLSMASTGSYCDEGVAVGIELVANKPSIIINLPATKLEGSNFSSQLLKISRIIN